MRAKNGIGDGKRTSRRFPEKLAIHAIVAMLPFFSRMQHDMTQFSRKDQIPLLASTPEYGGDDEYFMRAAIEQAQAAFQRGEVPVGAVLVHNGTILATGYNQREERQDPTAHAEMLAIQAAADVLGSWRLIGTTLYATLEPCAMCAGAIIQARISRLVFGAWDPKAGACGSICDITGETRWNHRVQVEAGYQADPCRQLLQTFFQQLRQPQPSLSSS